MTSAPIALTIPAAFERVLPRVAPLPVGFTPDELKLYLETRYPGEKTTATRATAAASMIYALSHPAELPEGGDGSIIGGCSWHKRFIVCKSRRSARVWQELAAHWCPVCIGTPDDAR
jgi:hypothetical protein